MSRGNRNRFFTRLGDRGLPAAATIFVAVSLCASIATAQSLPSEFNYQGRVTELDGTPLSGPTPMTFRLYDVDQGGVEAWTESQTVDVDAGVFSVRLGGVNPLSVDFAIQMWLEIEVDGDPMGTRMPLVPVPYAHHAVNAELLDGVVVDELEESQEIEDALADHETDLHPGQGDAATWTHVHNGSYSDFVCGVHTDGAAECWGNRRMFLPGEYEQVTTGDDHLCALKTDGTLVCFGEDDKGQASPPAGTYTQITSGQDHNCAIRTDQSVECWGDDTYGQASPPAGSFLQIDTSAFDTCAVKADQSIECWGYNGPSPLPADTYDQVTVGITGKCAVRTDGALACTGTQPPLGDFLQVDAGHNFFCALATDQALECWGNTQWYQVFVPAGTYQFLNTGHQSSCAIRVDGGIDCWGMGGDGRCDPP